MVTWTLQGNEDLLVLNEDDPRVFSDFQLRSDEVLARVVAAAARPAVFFKAFNDTPGVFSLLRLFPRARIVYAIRRPAHATASFVREFGESGRREWIRRWTDAAEGRNGALRRMCRGDEASWAIAQRNAAAALEAIAGREHVAQNVAAGYYLWQHAFFLERRLATLASLRLYDYDDLVGHPADVMAAITDWIGVRRVDTSTRTWHAGRGADPEGHVSPDLLDRCEQLYARILSASMSTGQRIVPVGAADRNPSSSRSSRPG